MENYTGEVIIIDKQSHSKENYFDLSSDSECLLTQNGIARNIGMEDVLLDENILTYESDVSCPNQQVFFTSISAFDNNFGNCYESSVQNCMNNPNVENEIMQEVVVEEIAELEIGISDSLICEIPLSQNTQEDRLRIDNRQQCDICCRKFLKKSSLSRHLLRYHSKILSYPCFECGKSFARKTTLMDHLQNHKKYQETEFTDIIESSADCHENERNQCSKLSHSTYCSRSKSLKAGCGEVLAPDEEISNHFFVCKSSPKSYVIENQCEVSKICGSSGDVCSQRIISCSKHNEKKPNNKALVNYEANQNLMISDCGSSATKIFPCYACDKTFSSKSSQQIHTRVHTGERPYKCRFCVKAFADGGTRRKHERIHTGEKPYMCLICEKAFNQRVVLREHIRIYHIKINEHYKCEICSEVFNTSQNLCYHLVKHSDDNTAKHRALLNKPRIRKYKKSSCSEKAFSQTYVVTKSLNKKHIS